MNEEFKTLLKFSYKLYIKAIWIFISLFDYMGIILFVLVYLYVIKLSSIYFEQYVSLQMQPEPKNNLIKILLFVQVQSPSNGYTQHQY